MKVLVLGDPYCPVAALRPAFDALVGHEVTYGDVEIDPAWSPTTESERKLREYLGSPAQIIAALADHEVLVVQGAPISDAVIEAGRGLKLIGVVRGGPVNVDIAAATARGIPVVPSPGRNATAVAELTIALMVMLARRLKDAIEHVGAGAEVFVDNYEGGDWFGLDLAGKTLGLVGFGAVGRRVSTRARAFEMRVIAHDPFVLDADVRANGVEPVGLDRLLDEADFVSLHARATDDNRRLFGPERFARMRRGSYFINTARDLLVDEEALEEALRSGSIGGAALDVASPSPAGERHRLLSAPNVILLPHLGGATLDALANGGRIVAEEIERFAAGRPLRHVANATVVATGLAS